VAVVTVVATAAFLGSLAVIIVTLVNSRPIPGIDALVVPAIVLSIAGGAWAEHAISLVNPTESTRASGWSAITGRFTHPRAWSGLPRSARWILGCVVFVLFIVVQSSNPWLGGYHNNSSLPLCEAGRVVGSACVSRALHLHALAAHQRFLAAICAGWFTLVIGVALGRWRSHPPSADSSPGPS
jgi:hypothetical protein